MLISPESLHRTFLWSPFCCFGEKQKIESHVGGVSKRLLNDCRGNASRPIWRSYVGRHVSTSQQMSQFARRLSKVVDCSHTSVWTRATVVTAAVDELRTPTIANSNLVHCYDQSGCQSPRRLIRALVIVESMRQVGPSTRCIHLRCLTGSVGLPVPRLRETSGSCSASLVDTYN